MYRTRCDLGAPCLHAHTKDEIRVDGALPAGCQVLSRPCATGIAGAAYKEREVMSFVLAKMKQTNSKVVAKQVETAINCEFGLILQVLGMGPTAADFFADEPAVKAEVDANGKEFFSGMKLCGGSRVDEFTCI
jgi:hypothetical protein